MKLNALFLLCSVPLWALSATNDPETDQYFTLVGDFAASHILISYKGAESQKPDVVRTKEQALERANEVLKRLKADPDQFSELARVFSDGPSGPTGGGLGSFKAGEMAMRFEKALKDLADGAFTQEPVLTQFGYHIIRRDPMRVKQFASRAVLLTFRGALPVNGLKDDFELRDEEDAMSHARALRANLTNESFITVAREESHLAQRNAFLGVIRKGQTAIFDQIVAQLETLDYDGISEPIRLPIGIMILQRVKVEKLGAQQILITHIDSPQSPENVLRTRNEARELAQKILKQIQEKPKKFERLAKKHSDDRFGVNGGMLPRWYSGAREPSFDAAVKSLGPGELLDEPLETEAGFYIIRRTGSP